MKKAARRDGRAPLCEGCANEKYFHVRKDTSLIKKSCVLLQEITNRFANG
jgi:hypothetical protein